MVQADFYLEQIRPGKDELMALDLEELSEKFMTLKDAKKFILRIKEKTGRYPVLYGNYQTVQAISEQVGKDKVFS